MKRILGLSKYYHDGAAALADGGCVLLVVPLAVRPAVEAQPTGGGCQRLQRLQARLPVIAQVD